MYFEDIHSEITMETPPVKITKEMMLDFSTKYDPLPVHCDEEYAKTTRFGQLIAPGVMSFMVLWSEVIKSDLFKDELIAGKSTCIYWHKPVFENDVLIGKLRITNLERRNPYNGLVETTIDAYNQKGEMVLTNVTETVVKCKNTGK